MLSAFFRGPHVLVSRSRIKIREDYSGVAFLFSFKYLCFVLDSLMLSTTQRDAQLFQQSTCFL